MKLSDLKFDYPEELIATSPSRPTRVMIVDQQGQPQEINISQLIDLIPAGDVLVLNDTKVLKRRVFAGDLEILFLEELPSGQQKVLFPSKKYKVGDEIVLPNGAKMKLLEKGLPQLVEVTPRLTESDFDKFGELPLPPYIQKARDARHNVEADESWYQTAWAQNPGSFAAPTASLHFTDSDLKKLEAKGVKVLKITLHVGLGTFLPVKTENLDDHKMHAEVYDVPEKVWNDIQQAKANHHKVWALGTTVTRTLETVARTKTLSGSSEILLQEGSEFLVVDRLMTNFHQPESTLLALVSGFSSLENVKRNYSWAIERKFKLFSYGDFSVWLR
ncbi:tRNA preQ1(34) S-adenosylmethionine ribosyltransferase-isomerase QueA [Bdellovibrio sp. qaytius]|nr:tRNA preQ1(34) S-adenosylmethionine ribosyltransferase-isomerase QueA [Bdellovibrio sp. qaytius]